MNTKLDNIRQALQVTDNFVRATTLAIEQLTTWADAVDWPAVIASIEYFQRGQWTDDLKNVALSAQQSGWFLWLLDGCFDDVINKLIALRGADSQTIDAFMRQYVDAHRADFHLQLIKAYPKRSQEINEAFELHNLGHYSGSVSLFLSITDGICRELHGDFSIYSKQKCNLRIKRSIEAADGLSALDTAVLSPLYTSSALTRNTKQLSDQRAKGTNRNAILHGEAIGYGTSLNSLKMISWTYYAHQAMSHFTSEGLLNSRESRSSRATYSDRMSTRH